MRRKLISLLLLSLLLDGCSEMSRRDYKIKNTGCTLGINQQLDKSLFEECADAVNMWAPNGRLEQRPGYVGVSSAFITLFNPIQTALTNPVFIKETPLGTFSTTGLLNTLGAGMRWYAGFDAYDNTGFVSGDEISKVGGLSVIVTTQNTNDMTACAEYWNGSVWNYLPLLEQGSTNDYTNNTLVSKHLSIDPALGIYTYFAFTWPQDLARTTVNGLTKYFFRFTLQSVNASTALSAGTEISAAFLGSGSTFNAFNGLVPPYLGVPSTLFIQKARFATTRKYIGYFIEAFTGVMRPGVFNAQTLQGFTSSDIQRSFSSYPNEPLPLPPTFAVAAQFNSAFLAVNGRIHEFFANPTSTDGDPAVVESRDFAVGPNAPYDSNFVAQLSEFPKARYIAYFNNRLWFAGIEGEPFTIRWGAAAPYFKVLPAISTEPVISSDDNSVITGIAPLGEQLVVFKENSIWVMVDSGQNAFGLASFTPVRRLSGVGCVSNASIQAVRGELIFLARDGLYAFNGVSVRKVSEVSREAESIDRLKDFWPTMNTGRLQYAVGALYKKRNVYLLALAVDGSFTNNRVLVWDFAHDTMWIWTNMEVQGWIDEAPDLVFYDWRGRAFQFDVGNLDNNGAIDSYIVTQRVGFEDRASQGVREIQVSATPLAKNVSVEILPDGAITGQVGNASGTVQFTDPAEKNFDAAIFNRDYFTLDRIRKAHIGVWPVCNYWQARVRHSDKGTPFTMSSLSLGYVDLGAR